MFDVFTALASLIFDSIITPPIRKRSTLKLRLQYFHEHGSCNSRFMLVTSDCFYRRLFTRILLDVPALTDGAVMAIRMYCEDLVSVFLVKSVNKKFKKSIKLPSLEEV